jgi:hypothetical protein
VRADIRSDVPTGRVAASTAGALPLSARVVGATLVLSTGWMHLHLWLDGYRDIPGIGPLFLTDVVLAVLGAVALLLAPDRWVPGVAVLTGLFEGASLAALLLSLTVGLLGFTESWSSPLVIPGILVQGAGFVLLAGFGTMQARRSRQRSLRG